VTSTSRRREELGEPDEPDVGLAAGDVVRLLLQRDRLQRHSCEEREVADRARRAEAPDLASV
jgi:hypothetical protein